MDPMNTKAFADVSDRTMDEDTFYAYHACEWLQSVKAFHAGWQTAKKAFTYAIAGVALKGPSKYDTAK